MRAVTQELVDTIRELQSMRPLQAFALAGGTSLALRYDHRQSIDIDLFSNQMVGLAGLQAIEAQLKGFYGNNLIFCKIENPVDIDQYYWLKAFIRKNEELTIKVEVLQNIALTENFEIFNELRLLSVKGQRKLIDFKGRNPNYTEPESHD